VQVMSAGTGVMHSEFNPSETEEVNLFQLWIFPSEKGIMPRYDQRTFSIEERKNRIQLVASGFKLDGELYIHQDAALSLCNPEKDKPVSYVFHRKGNGAYVMVVNGSVEINGTRLEKRDALGIWDTGQVDIRPLADAELLIVEVPMN
jgi:redox-sensitive bicupin YhaK (pirin superfamily)